MEVVNDPRHVEGYTLYGGLTGGTGGSEFTLLKEGTIVTGIDFWQDGNLIKGLKVTFDDSSDSQMVGQAVGKHKPAPYMSFDPRSRFARIAAASDGNGGRLGYFQLQGMDGSVFSVGEEGQSGEGPRYLEVGSGLLLGFKGRVNDAEIVALEPIFLDYLVGCKDTFKMSYLDAYAALEDKTTFPQTTDAPLIDTYTYKEVEKNKIIPMVAFSKSMLGPGVKYEKKWEWSGYIGKVDPPNVKLSPEDAFEATWEANTDQREMDPSRTVSTTLTFPPLKEGEKSKTYTVAVARLQMIAAGVQYRTFITVNNGAEYAISRSHYCPEAVDQRQVVASVNDSDWLPLAT